MLTNEGNLSSIEGQMSVINQPLVDSIPFSGSINECVTHRLQSVLNEHHEVFRTL